MPIYQRRVYSVVKPPKDVNDGDKLFTIAHTGEQFKDESEYRARSQLYEQSVWTCQCTGHTSLTHQQAWESERTVRAMLEKQFPAFLRKPVLSVVHHSTKSLDALIDDVFSLIHSRLHKDEAVLLLRHDKALGHVVDVKDPENACGSPSSDKENKESEGAAPNGRFPPQMPFRYTVRVEKGDRVLSGLPPTDLSRAERLPSRDLLRLFIRSSAMRQGTSSTAPWVVSPALFVQHGLKNKIASIFLPASERNDPVKSNLPPKKRKLADEKEQPAKKPKLAKNTPKTTPKTVLKTVPKSNKTTPTSGSSKEAVAAKTVVSDAESDCEVLANIASSSKTKSVLKVQISPNNMRCSSAVVMISPLKTQNGLDSDSDDDIKLSVLAKSPVKKLSFGNAASSPKKATIFGKKSGGPIAKQGGKQSASKLGSGVKEKDSLSKQKAGQGRPKKSDSKQLKQSKILEVGKKKRGRPRKEDSAKRMKQISLFDLGKKKREKSPKKAPKSPQKSAQSSPKKPSLPPCVRKLTREIESGKKIHMHNPLLNTCVNVLRREQMALIVHEATRALILKRRAVVEETRMLSRMTPEQREEYLKLKKEQRREEQKATLEQRRLEKRLRFEDQSLQLSALPAAAPVPLPAAFAPHLFGAVAMVSEFLGCYSGLLGAEPAPPPLQQLLDAVSGGSAHETLLLRLVAPLLKLLINDEDEETEELGTPLRRVPATPQTATELVRLTLRPSRNEDEQPVCHWLSAALLERLESAELYELSPEERADVLLALVHRVLATDALVEHQEATADKLRSLWHQRHAIYKNRKSGDQGGSIEPSAEPAAAAPEAAETADEGKETPTPGRSTRVRRNPEEARKEKERQEAAAKQRRETLMRKDQLKREETEVMRQFEAASARQAAQQRRAPLGQDRHHRRYWLLPSLPAALYVETGWAAADTLQDRVPAAGQQAAPETQPDDSDEEQPLRTLQQRAASGVDDLKQATLPEPGPNVWYQYTSIREVDALLAALAEKGVRESALHKAITAHYSTLKTLLGAGNSPVKASEEAAAVIANGTQPSIEDAKASAAADAAAETEAAEQEVTGACNGLSSTDDQTATDADKDSDPAPETKPEESSGRQFLLSTLKEDMLSIEEELKAGSIGGVPESSTWVAQVLSADQLATLTEALLLCQRHVLRHALQGPLATEGGEGSWLQAVTQCRTLSRLHVLVGLLDSAIKWELSNAEKKCKVCRRRGEGAVSVCTGCYQLYHWHCQRPRPEQPPGADWLCPACKPVTLRPRTRAPALAAESSSEDEPEQEKEEECRVCGGAEAENLIFCTRCPAAFHRGCHEPPLLLRVRPGWECMDCQAAPRKRRGTRSKVKRAKQPLPSELLRAARAADQEEEEEESSEEEEAEEEEEEEEGGNEEQEADGEDNGDDEEEAETEEGENDEAEEREDQPEENAENGVQSESEEEEETPPAPPPRRRAFREEKPARKSSSGRAKSKRRIVSDEDDGEASEEEVFPSRSGRRSGRRGSRDTGTRHSDRRAARARVTYTERSESDIEPSEGEPAPAPPPEKSPSPSKLDLVQRADAVCMYCDQPRTHRNELAVCRTCPALYHRRCAAGAGLVDAWQCAACVLPDVYRPRRPAAADAQSSEQE